MFNLRIILCVGLLICLGSYGKKGVIEKQLEEIGSVPHEEVVVVQGKYTRKSWRHELTPLMIGGVPFGSFRRTLMGGASYVLHFNDSLGWEAFNFIYSRNFFSSFTDDINNHPRTGQPSIAPDIQKLLFLATTGIQWNPTYGKVATFARWIAYVEPLVSAGLGLAKTETNQYLSFYVGIGLRIFFREWVSMRLDFRDYLYSEDFINRNTGSPDSSLRNNYAVMLSLSFWLPKMPG